MKNKVFLLLILIGMISILIACGGEREEKDRGSGGKFFLRIGLSTDEVRTGLGEPPYKQKIVLEGEYYEEWKYRYGTEDKWVYIYFKDGIVKSFKTVNF